MSVELTQLSAEEYEHLRSGNLTPIMAAEYLKEERLALRSFTEVLHELYPGPDLQARLVAAFEADDPKVKPGAVSRRIRNWMAGQNRPTNREDIFRIAFALGLTEAQANYLLGICTDFGIHYREGRDVVYAWFLRHGLSYREARDFFATLPPCPRQHEVPKDATAHITKEVQNTFQFIHSQEDLRECYIANLENFGYLHMRAYTYFEGYMDQLIHPAAAWGGLREPDYSLEAVMQVYLSLNMPSGKDRSGYSVTQRLLKRGWPNTTFLKNVRNHKEDVPRKLLLLLYVITENVLDDNYHEQDEAYISKQDRMDDHWYTLNAILLDCGMPQLDPRNATDWLVLYAIAAEEEPMSERMEQVIEYMFADIK